MAKRKKPSNEKGHRAFAPYSSKLIKAGALIGDTKTLLSHWDASALLTKAIQSAPGLGFTLGLADMRLYQTAPGKDWPLLAVPEVVGRTVEQTRGVVRIQYVQEKPTVTVAVEGDEGDGDTIGKLDLDQFFQSIPPDLAEPIRKGIQEWEALGGRIHFTEKMLCFEVTLDGQVYRVVRFWKRR